MKKFFRSFEDTMAAAAFAEAGEFETARDMLRENRRVLLALSGEKSDMNAFRHALNLCKRIHAALEVLHVSGEKTGLPDMFCSELRKNGVEYEYIHREGCIKDQILKHTDNNRNTILVVVESSEKLDINCAKKPDKALRDFWKKLKCPLVVVSDLANA